MLDNLCGGRMEFGVGRGGIMEAFFWGQEADSEINFARYNETLEIVLQGLSNDELDYQGEFHQFDKLTMRLHPIQKPYPPVWYMRNPETAAIHGMNTVIVGGLDNLDKEVERYHRVWAEHHGEGSLTVQGTEPKIGLVVHMVIADTDEEAIEIAKPAWESYRWNLAAPRRLEAEKRGLDQFLHSNDGSFGFSGDRPAGLPDRETRKDVEAELETFAAQKRKANPTRLGGVALAGSPESVREYMEEYVATGANYMVCSFQWGSLSHQHAMRSIELFTSEVMPHYAKSEAIA